MSVNKPALVLAVQGNSLRFDRGRSTPPDNAAAPDNAVGENRLASPHNIAATDDAAAPDNA